MYTEKTTTAQWIYLYLEYKTKVLKELKEDYDCNVQFQSYGMCDEKLYYFHQYHNQTDY